MGGGQVVEPQSFASLQAHPVRFPPDTEEGRWSTRYLDVRRRRLPGPGDEIGDVGPVVLGRVYGNLMALLTAMKGVPLTYSKDLQEDKEPLFDSFDTVEMCLAVFAGAWGSMCLKPERMAAAAVDTILATDLADYLARRGVPFREAHHMVGALVRETVEAGGSLGSLSLAQLQKCSPEFGEDSLALLEPGKSLELRNIQGGTGPQAVRQQLERARSALAD
ncbi:hypothetical protein ACFL6X_09390 [Candidatus Latescibacterota bacterium]